MRNLSESNFWQRASRRDRIGLRIRVSLRKITADVMRARCEALFGQLRAHISAQGTSGIVAFAISRLLLRILRIDLSQDLIGDVQRLSNSRHHLAAF
jgi:hypothetical protein